MIVTMNHFPMRNFNKKLVKSWQKCKRKNVTPIVTPIM